MDMLVAVALPAFADEFEHAGGVGEAAKTMGEPVVDLAKPGFVQRDRGLARAQVGVGSVGLSGH